MTFLAVAIIAIAVLAIGFNLVADGIARSVGRSTDRPDG